MESRWHELRRQMVIEITEEEEIDHEALETKRHAPGFSGMFALDDYGSGFANENSLLELSPRFIKVDITIIRGIDTDPTSSRSCRTSWPMPTRAACRSLPRAWRPPPSCKVMELGADALQGYFLAKPAAVPAQMAPAARNHCRQLIRQRLNTNIKVPQKCGLMPWRIQFAGNWNGQTTAQEVLFYYGTGRPYHRLSGGRQNHLSAPVCPVSGGTGPQRLHSGKRLWRGERGCHAGAGPSGPNCDLETISGGCDCDTHQRRMRTKLIAMAMRGFDRVVVEPSGIFDVDEFFDVLRDDPLDRWYHIGNVIAIVDAMLPETLSPQAEYLLASETPTRAGCWSAVPSWPGSSRPLPPWPT